MFHFSGKRLIKASRSVKDGVDSWNSSCSSTIGGGGIRILALQKVTDDPSVSNERLPDSRSVSSTSRAPLFFFLLLGNTSQSRAFALHDICWQCVASPHDFDSGGTVMSGIVNRGAHFLLWPPRKIVPDFSCRTINERRDRYTESRHA